MIKRKRGRPRKYPKLPPKNTDMDPKSITDGDSDPNNLEGVPSVPTKIENIGNTSGSSEDLDAERSEDQETFAMPEEWQNIDWEILRAEGWKPRIKKDNGREYMTIRVVWTEDDGSRHSKEKSFGPYDPESYKMLKNILLDAPPTNASTETRSDSKEPIEAEESSESKHIRMPEEHAPVSPSNYRIREAKILRSPIGKAISIPNQFYFDTDVLQLFEHFKNHGYAGNIVDWMHECVRNYLTEHHYRVGVILERRGNM